MSHLIVFVGFFLNLMLSILSIFVSKNKNQILIGCRDATKFSGNPKAFFLFLCKNETSLQPYWITKNKKIFSKLQHNEYPILHLFSLKGFVAILRSNYLLFDNSALGLSYGFSLWGKFKKIETWHGTGIKNFMPFLKTSKRKTIFKNFEKWITNNETKSYHTIITCSESSKKIEVAYFKNHNVKILGYPRNDVLFHKNLIFEDYYKKLNLGDYKKIIVYCPTFRENFLPQNPFSKTFFKILNDYLKSQNFILLDKRHVLELQNTEYPTFSNIINVSREIEDIQDLLVYTDIIITDYSTTLFDFILLDKPIIYFPYDFEEFLKEGGVCFDYFNELPGPFAKNENELLECIKNIQNIGKTKEYQEKYQKLKEKNHVFQDGNSCQRLYNFLMTRL